MTLSNHTSARGVKPGSAGGGEVDGVPPDRRVGCPARIVDMGTVPAQTKGKETGMAGMLGGMSRGKGAGDRRGRGGEFTAQQRRPVDRGRGMGAPGRAPAD